MAIMSDKDKVKTVATGVATACTELFKLETSNN